MPGSVEIELKPRGTDFVRAVARLKGEGPVIRRRLTAGVKAATQDAESKLKEAIMGLDSTAHGSSRGGGGKARDESHAQRLLDASNKRRLKNPSKPSKPRIYTWEKTRNTSLRANIARGITRKISTSGNHIGVRVRASADYLPANQKVLVKATNRGKVRHPYFGNRDIWVDQTFTPAGWFDNTMKIYGPDTVRKIEYVARQIMRDLQK